MLDVQIDDGGNRDLVMLYGTPVPAESLSPIDDWLSDDFRIITPETVSIGVTPDEALPGLKQALQEHDVSEPVLLGHSLGAYRAFQLALDDDFDVHSLVLIGPLAVMPDERLEQYNEMAEQLSAGELDLAEVAIELWFRPEYVESNPEVGDQVRRWFQQMGDDALIDCLHHELTGPDLHSKLDQIDVPACVIVGDQDVGTPPEWAERIHELLPDSEMHLIRDCAHFPHYEKPAPTRRILESFLSS